MTTEETEVTLRQIMRSAWFAIALRGALFAIPCVLTASGTIGALLLSDIKSQGAETAKALQIVKSDVADIQRTQQGRADQADNRNAQVDQVLDKVSHDVKATSSNMLAIQLAMAEVSGMLKQMQMDRGSQPTALRIH